MYRPFRVADSLFEHNSARDGQAGAIYLNMGYNNLDSAIVRSNFTSNSAQNGGAIFFNYLPVTRIESCEFVENTARYDGGALQQSYTFADTFTIADSNFARNIAEENYGGAMYLVGGAESFVVEGSTFDSNTAKMQAALGILRLTGRARHRLPLRVDE